jgi:hypothetical protein
VKARALVSFSRLGAALTVATVLAIACDGQENQYVYGEPILVHGAQFIPGALPGSPAPSMDASVDATVPDAASSSATSLAVTSIQAINTTVFSGEAGKQLSGRASANANAVGIRLGELGTGYWVLPLGNPDPEFPGELTWSAIIDFNASDPPGLQPLRVVAIGPSGNAGVEADQSLCLASRLPADPGSPYPNDLSTCNAALSPPAAVFALTWDADLDVDLHVITPSGIDVNPKSPLLTPVEAGATPLATTPRIDRDSIASCIPDGWREEDLAFPTLPASGSVFQIHANLFAACGLPSVNFTLTVYQSVATADAGHHLVQAYQQSGLLTAFDADGDSTGLFIVSYPF